jgi:organic hydroperoxide reductase OsmC/OhrA
MAGRYAPGRTEPSRYAPPVATVAKRLEFAVDVDRERTVRSERGGEPIERSEEWSAEHLLLAALLRCTLTSLDYHAGRVNVRATADGRAQGVVTKRESDGRYAFVEIGVEIDAALDPPLAGDELHALVAKAERDCFVGASLVAAPRYRWTIDGEELR